jgi:flagellar biosynthesis GTPase FlhF
MRFMLILSLLMTITSFAQSPRRDFLEISPEQEKKIQEREQKRKDEIGRKQEEARRVAEKKKIKEEAEKIAAQKKEEEIKRLEAEKKKKAEVEAYTKWLISEKERKMKEAEAQAKAQAPSKAQVSSPSQPKVSPQKSHLIFSGKPGGNGFATMAEIGVPAKNDEQSVKDFKVPDGVRIIAIGGVTGTPRKNKNALFGKQFPLHTVVNVVSRRPYILLLMAKEKQSWFMLDTTKLVAIFNESGDVQKTTINSNAPIFHNNLKWGDKWGIASTYLKDETYYNDESKMKAVLEEYSRRLFKQEVSHFQYHRTLPEKIDVIFPD